MENNVAIVGVSLRLPGAKNLSEFSHILYHSKSCIDKISKERLDMVGLDKDKEYLNSGTINNIDEFDYEYFRLSKFEAEFMDPQMRLNLILAHELIENAGYRLKDISNTDTAIYTVESSPFYFNRFQDYPSEAITGNEPGMYAGRLAHFFNTRGIAIVVNALCSSFSVALNEAILKVKTKEVKQALVGGMGLLGGFRNKIENDVLGVVSPDSTCRPFDIEANGIVESEGGGYILIKNLSDAIKDNDNILAVIKQSHVNHDGNTSNGITAPSLDAQRSLLIRSWEKAGIDPEKIEYIECHGTATELGDAIEFEALDKAFKEFTSAPQVCPIGSVKSNIGHIGNMAGFAGLLKVILTVKDRVIFPTVNFNSPNKFIDYKTSAIYINTKVKKIESLDPVIAGVSSFGLSGTNAHIIIQEYKPSTKEQHEDIKEEKGFVKFSAKSKKSLFQYIDKFRQEVETNKYNLHDIIHTQNLYKDDYHFRVAILFENKEDLLVRLNNVIFKEEINTDTKPKGIILFLPSVLKNREIDLPVLHHPVFEDAYKECMSILGNTALNDNLNTFIYQYSLYKLLISLKLKPTKILGSGVGKITSAVIFEEINIEKAIDLIIHNQCNEMMDVDKFNAFISAMTEETLILEINTENTVSALLYNKIKNLTTLHFLENGHLLPALQNLYQRDLEIDFHHIFRSSFKKVILPYYQFENKKCWIDIKPGTAELIEPASPAPIMKEIEAVEAQTTETEYQLIQIWGHVFKSSTISIEDDFYESGGNSLLGIRIINSIEEKFNKRIKLEHIFKYSTIQKLAKYIDLLNTYSDDIISPCFPQEDYELSNAQLRIWSINKISNKSSNYNLTGAYSMEDIDIPLFIKALSLLVDRHEILRTNFIENYGIPRQKINENITLDCSVSSNIIDESAIKEIIKEQQNKPFDLAKDLLIRISIVKLNNGKHCFILTLHHIIIDIWSLNILLQEIQLIYRSLITNTDPDLPVLKIQYKDYSIWHNTMINGHNTYKQYWRTKLPSEIEPLPLNADYSRPAMFSYKGKKESRVLEASLFNDIKSLQTESRTTGFILWQSFINVFLYKQTGCEDIIIGAPFANRPKANFDNQVGLYLDTLPLYNKLNPAEHFSDVIEKIQKTTMEAFDNQMYPLNSIISDLRLKRNISHSNPLFDFMIVYLEEEDSQDPLINLKTLDNDEIDETSKFDITFYILKKKDTYKIDFEYNSDIFTAETISVYMEDLINMIKLLVVKNYVIKDLHFNRYISQPMNDDGGTFNF